LADAPLLLPPPALSAAQRCVASLYWLQLVAGFLAPAAVCYMAEACLRLRFAAEQRARDGWAHTRVAVAADVHVLCAAAVQAFLVAAPVAAVGWLITAQLAQLTAA
jgi:hypothetical protein